MDVGGALGFRDDISTLCLDSQVGIILRSRVAAASGLENLTAPSAPIIVIHSYKYFSSQRPSPKQPTHVSSSPRSPRSDILVRRRNWWPTPMTVTHFTTVTNSRLRSRAVETSCSTTSEWSEYFQNHHHQRQYCDCPHHHHNYHHHQNHHHHHSQTCDWPRSVMQIRPECRDPESFRFRLGPRSWDSRRSGMMRATLMMIMMMAMAL